MNVWKIYVLLNPYDPVLQGVRGLCLLNYAPKSVAEKWTCHWIINCEGLPNYPQFQVPSSEVEGVSFWSLMPQIQRIIARSLRRSRFRSEVFGPHGSLPWSKAEQTQAAYTLPRIKGDVSGGEDRKKFAEPFHYIDVIMTTIASQITSLTVVFSTVYSDVDQRKHQSSASLAFVWGSHRDRWIPRTKGQLHGKCFHLMTSSCPDHTTTGGNGSVTASTGAQHIT